MSLVARFPNFKRWSPPRASGDEPLHDLGSETRAVSAPRQRG